ncbi:MAG: hypothetical protein IKO01_09205 [Kiritimatiellae bacterium]|nr:hypothetical protein [Kiritimatiellia bacterium]
MGVLLTPERVLAEIGEDEENGADAETILKRIKRVCRSVLRKRMGEDEWADEMLAESEDYKRVAAGRKAANARWKKNECDSQSHDAPAQSHDAIPQSHDATRKSHDAPHDAPAQSHDATAMPRARARRPTDLPTYRPISPTDPIARGRAREDGPSGSVVGDVPSEVGVGSESDGAAGAPAPTDDAYSEIGGTPDERLPDLAVVFCRESDPTRALNEYRKAMKEMEPWRFRIILDKFVGDCKEDEPRSRGKVFMSRIMETLKELRDRRRQENALAVPK